MKTRRVESDMAAAPVPLQNRTDALDMPVGTISSEMFAGDGTTDTATVSAVEGKAVSGMWKLRVRGGLLAEAPRSAKRDSGRELRSAEFGMRNGRTPITRA